jgi:hypothetical protein
MSEIQGFKPVGHIQEAFYMRPKNGGFQLMKITIEDDVVLLDEPVSDPDAWNQVMSELEHEMSKKFQ